MQQFSNISEMNFFEQTGHNLTELIVLALLILAALPGSGMITLIGLKLVYNSLGSLIKGIPFNQFNFIIRKPLARFLRWCLFKVAFGVIHFKPEWSSPGLDLVKISYYVHLFLLFMVLISGIRLATSLIDAGFKSSQNRAMDEEDALRAKQLLPYLRELLRITAWIFGIFTILGMVFQVNVYSLIAGLGVGGLALALASKETVENLFASFTIFLDKPFAVGDTIHAGSIQGEVEKIGFRSTRIRTEEKSFLTVPNKQLVDQVLNNLSHKTGERIELGWTFSIQNSPEKVSDFAADARNVIARQPEVLFETIHIWLDKVAIEGYTLKMVFLTKPLSESEINRLKERINFALLALFEQKQLKFQVL